LKLIFRNFTLLYIQNSIMETISIITHQSNRIVFFDGKNLKEDEICKGIEKLTESAIQNKINLIMLDISGTHTTPKVRETAALANKRANATLGKTYNALIGLSQLQRIIANAINREQYFASNIEDAKNWLISKNKK
jgi:hypothetical protein